MSVASFFHAHATNNAFTIACVAFSSHHKKKTMPLLLVASSSMPGAIFFHYLAESIVAVQLGWPNAAIHQENLDIQPGRRSNAGKVSVARNEHRVRENTEIQYMHACIHTYLQERFLWPEMNTGCVKNAKMQVHTCMHTYIHAYIQSGRPRQCICWWAAPSCRGAWWIQLSGFLWNSTYFYVCVCVCVCVCEWVSVCVCVLHVE